MRKPVLKEGQVEKYGQNLKKLSFFQGNQGELFQFCTGRIEAHLLHILDPNYPSFYLKCLRKCQKTYNLTFFKQFPKFAPLPLLNFGVDLKFDHIRLCVYYQSYAMQSLVFLTYCFQTLSKKNFFLWGDQLDPPPWYRKG